MKAKVGLIKYAWVCVYAPVNGSSKKDMDGMEKFWMSLNECLRKFESDRRIILLGDMNARVGGQEIGKIVEGMEWMVQMRMERCWWICVLRGVCF